MEAFIRKLLNLPPKKQQEPANVELPASDPWSEAGRAVQQSANKQKSHSAWSPVDTQRSDKVWHRLVRGLVVVVLLFILAAGVRTIFFSGNRAAPAQEVSSTVYFPQTAAGGVAERYVANYYTWDQAAADRRAQALSIDRVGGPVASGTFGWDGKGKQTVNTTNVVSVDPENDKVGVVTVRFNVTPYKYEGKAWVAKAPRVMAADVKVQIIEGRAAVVGTPALVAVPPVPPAPGTTNEILDDPQITRDTAEYATTFFRAYGEEKDVTALTAPGAQIAGIGGLRLERVSKWSVLSGDADQRHAVATVQWRINDATTLDQSYDVTLMRVTSGDTERWQVAALQGK